MLYKVFDKIARWEPTTTFTRAFLEVPDTKI